MCTAADRCALNFLYASVHDKLYYFMYFTLIFGKIDRVPEPTPSAILVDLPSVRVRTLNVSGPNHTTECYKLPRTSSGPHIRGPDGPENHNWAQPSMEINGISNVKNPWIFDSMLM